MRDNVKGTGNASPEVLGSLADEGEKRLSGSSRNDKIYTVAGIVGIFMLLAAPAAMMVAFGAFEKDRVSDPFMQWLSFEHGYYSLVQFGLVIAVIGAYCIWMAWLRDWITPCVMLLGAPAAWLYCNSAVGFEPYVHSMGELFHWMAGYAIILHVGIVLTVCGIVMLIVKTTVAKNLFENAGGEKK